jgi:hypothetical protein
MGNEKFLLNIYGVVVSLSGSNEIINKLSSDFKYFLSDKDNSNIQTHLSININFINPTYEKIPQVCASMYKTDCICYDYNNLRYTDYNGKGLVIFDKKNKSAEIYSTDNDFLYEISYLLLHSQVGELLDTNGYHRVHSCSFSYNNKTFICMLPQGGGKSTLLMNLLKNNNIKLLSDDTPIINKNGDIYPFPIRIGICNDFDTSDIDEKFISIFNRRKFGQKKLVSYEYFKDRIEKEHFPTTIILGKRVYSNTAMIIQTNRFYAFIELLKNCVIGYGLPQVIEYFLVGGFKDIIKKTCIVFSRLYACIGLLLKTKQVYYFYLSKNKDNNSSYFTEFFNR